MPLRTIVAPPAEVVAIVLCQSHVLWQQRAHPQPEAAPFFTGVKLLTGSDGEPTNLASATHQEIPTTHPAKCSSIRNQDDVFCVVVPLEFVTTFCPPYQAPLCPFSASPDADRDEGAVPPFVFVVINRGRSARCQWSGHHPRAIAYPIVN